MIPSLKLNSSRPDRFLPYPERMLHLASKSPRRRQLLQQIGVPFQPLDVDVPELPGAGERAEDYVRRVACDKARAGFARVAADADAVLGSDTEVVLDGEVFGKPAHAADATAMLERLSGRTHRVISCVCLVDATGERTATCISEVRLAVLDADTIAAYLATGESFGKAGGYAIQGHAATFIEHLSGSYSGVMGLPLHETARLLQEAGLWPVR
jgi:septum formation protein